MMYKELIKQLKSTLKKDLVSVTQFGTEGEPNNVLIIAKSLDFSVLEKIKPIISSFVKKTRIVPILFTESGLKSSSDVFPLEILDMKYPHKVLFGKSVVDKIKIDKKHIRRQLEYELRSKLIHLRENFIGIKREKDLLGLVKSSIPTLMPLFYGLLTLKNQQPPTTLDELFIKVHEQYKVDMSIFLDVKNDDLDELSEVVKKLMHVLENLIDIVDKMKV